MKRRPVLDDWTPDPWDDPEEVFDFETEKLRPNRTLPRLVGFVATILIVAALLIGGGVGVWAVRQVNPSGTPGDKVNFTVEEGEDLDTVAGRLESQGIITSAKVFTWYTKQKGGYEPQVGYFTVRPKDNMGNVLKALRTPPALTYDKVTFPEGFTLDQFGLRLSKTISRLSAERFATEAGSGNVRSVFAPPDQPSLEGLLFPDTYQIGGNEDERKVLEKLVKQMERIGLSENIDKAEEKVGRTPYEVLIVASLIEREAKFQEDRPKIAQVIYNRLALGMPLQIDASLYYGNSTETPFSELREIDSPYNTYKYKGLPPTPIASPGRAAIAAAMNPAPSPPQSECIEIKKNQGCGYLFYVLKDAEGRHEFATNLDDHNANVKAAQAAGLLG